MPNNVIAAIRSSFPDAEYVYKNGACYQFFLILKSIWPQAVPYYDKEGHVYTDIDGTLYDIRGRARLQKHELSCMYERPDLMRNVHRWMPGMRSLRVKGALEEEEGR